MKGFIITITIFIVLLCTMFFNCYFVEKTINEMEEIVHTLNPQPCEENSILIDQIKKDWEKESIWLGLSVDYNDIKELTDIIDSLKAANETQNIEQFQIQVALLINAMDEIGRLERFSIKNIL